MPRTVQMKSRETGEIRDVYTVDAAGYNMEEWEQLGPTPSALPPRVVTTTMGKPIVPPPEAAEAAGSSEETSAAKKGAPKSR